MKAGSIEPIKICFMISSTTVDVWCLSNKRESCTRRKDCKATSSHLKRIAENPRCCVESRIRLSKQHDNVNSCSDQSARGIQYQNIGPLMSQHWDTLW